MRRELLEALEEVRGAPDVRCLVLRGRGRAFSAGQDLSEREPVTRGEDIDLGAELEGGFNRIVRELGAMPMPVLCGVHGVAAGAGANLALACDIVVATPSARFIQSFTRIGLVPDSGGSGSCRGSSGRRGRGAWRFWRSRSTARLRREWGLVWSCVPDDALEDELDRLAGLFANRSAHALAGTKAALRTSSSNTLDEQLDLERDLQREAGRSDEYRQSVAGFLKERSGRR